MISHSLGFPTLLLPMHQLESCSSNTPRRFYMFMSTCHDNMCFLGADIIDDLCVYLYQVISNQSETVYTKCDVISHNLTNLTHLFHFCGFADVRSFSAHHNPLGMINLPSRGGYSSYPGFPSKWSQMVQACEDRL